MFREHNGVFLATVPVPPYDVLSPYLCRDMADDSFHEVMFPFFLYIGRMLPTDLFELNVSWKELIQDLLFLW